jgi:hypothetical protein
MNKQQVLALGLSVLSITALAGPAMAGHRGHEVNQRQERQMDRIQQGERSGELTKGEAHRMMKNERRINNFERTARADGKIGPGEFRKLERMQNRESNAIYKQKHDGQERH